MHRNLIIELTKFDQFGTKSKVTATAWSDQGESHSVPTYINEFWTSKQRKGHSLHEVSYRACFKPQLPRFFIERLSNPGDAIYDPFMGRGTTLLESALLGRIPMGCDINPLSKVITLPRLTPPRLQDIEKRLRHIDFTKSQAKPKDLLTFYHPKTLQQINALKAYLLARQKSGLMDKLDHWIRMIAVNRLTGHSSGFFSVYTLPPNQAVSIQSQKKINHRRKQAPPIRDVPTLILKKTRSLLKDLNQDHAKKLVEISKSALMLSKVSHNTPQIPAAHVSLVVTSPPFLDVRDYAQDNWLRCRFCNIDSDQVSLTQCKHVDIWQEYMSRVFVELWRILKPGGYIAFEVGEVKSGKIKLEEAVLPCGVKAGFTPILILINHQNFTKTSMLWGINNMHKGTNTNRIVLFQKQKHNGRAAERKKSV